ncbi:MAG TPA: hypothetical protein VN722_11925 [Hanamia sp.]|nr:hypothetical protein [Hanamia sp.]
MPIALFNPFDTLHFDPETCFLTGNDLQEAAPSICIFPDWILDRFSLREKRFRLLDQVSGIRYEDLKLPCSAEVKKAFEIIDKEIKNAFEAGYEEVKKIPEERLFLWMGKIVYGVIYNEICLEISRATRRSKGKEFELSKLLRQRFAKLHLMLQSLLVPMEFKSSKPWTIRIVKLKYSKDTFNYKDEPTNLNFSLGMNGFGIVACLQDNGTIGKNQQEIIDKISDKVLHPIQFEELCSRFLYANYLLRKQSQHIIEIADEKVVIESLPMSETIADPLFAMWDDQMFAHVLEGYWEPWGFTKKDIITMADSPVSFLENDFTHEFIEPDSISLPF